MRIFGYILLVCGLGLVGYGVYRHYSVMGPVESTELELLEARKNWEAAKGTEVEEPTEVRVMALQWQILEDGPVAAVARARAKWWMGGGAMVCLVGLVVALMGKPRRRRTRGRYWA